MFLYGRRGSNVVFVSNSLYQLGRMLAAAKGKTPALVSQDEYTFFRSRYRARGQAGDGVSDFERRDHPPLVQSRNGASPRRAGPARRR